MNSPLGRNFPHGGKVEKRNHEFLKSNFLVRLYKIFLYIFISLNSNSCRIYKGISKTKKSFWLR